LDHPSGRRAVEYPPYPIQGRGGW